MFYGMLKTTMRAVFVLLLLAALAIGVATAFYQGETQRRDYSMVVWGCQIAAFVCVLAAAAVFLRGRTGIRAQMMADPKLAALFQ